MWHVWVTGDGRILKWIFKKFDGGMDWIFWLIIGRGDRLL
jgi:hypothetical protein